MKFTKLLVMSALWLCGLGANAAVDGNVWVKPAYPAVPEVTEFTTYEAVTATEGDGVYLYNVKTHLFFTSGNNWGTRASLTYATDGNGGGATAGEDVAGCAVYFLSSADAQKKGEGVVELKSYVPKFNEIRSTFAGGWNDIWTDNNSRADRFWTVTSEGDSYRISNVDTEKAKFLGWNGLDTRLYLLAADAEGVGVDWKIVTPEVYNAWKEALPEGLLDELKAWVTACEPYTAAMNLKAVLDEAQELGADVEAQVAVYNNTESTTAQLNDAITAATNALNAKKEEIEKQKQQEAYDNATGTNPAVVTNLHITNPSYAGGNNTGWTTSPAPGFGYTAAEHYEAVFETKQELSDLRQGVYALGLQAFYRPGFADGGYKLYTAKDPQIYDVKLYAVSGGDTAKVAIVTPYPEAGAKLGVGSESEVTTTADEKIYIPNNMQAAEAYFVETDRYHNKVFFESAGSTATIGMKNSASISGNWILYDNWSLTYYGSGADAYQAWSDASLAQYDTTAPAAGTLFTQSYVDALAAAITGKTATNKAEALANIAAADAAQEAYLENLSLWKQWSAQVDEAMKTYKANSDADIDTNIKLDLLEYIEDDEDIVCRANQIKKDMNLTNEELKAEMATLKRLVDNFEDAIKNQVKPGDDVTSLLKNPAFDDAEGAEKGWTGWHNTTNSMPTTGGTENNKTAEAWSAKNFDLYQVIENAPVGVYEISVQGFYRYGRDDNAWKIYNAQEIDYVKPKSAPVYVYMNDKKTPFKNIYDEDSKDMEFYVSMAQVDDEQNPQIDATTGVYKWKDIPYSVQNVTSDAPEKFYPNGMASAALCFSAGLYTQKATSLVAKKGDVLRLGVKGSTQQPDKSDCWVIWDNFKLTYKGKSAEDVKPVLAEAIEDAKNILKDPETGMDKPIGKDAYETLQKAIEEAQAALDSEDGTAMFDKLAALVSVDVDASATKFADLKNTFLKYEANINEAEAADASNKPSAATIAEAWDLHDEIMEGLDGRTLTDADADRLTEEMAAMTKKLQIPAIMDEASDDQPANATYMITNPKYADNAKDGWSGTEASVANHEAEIFGKNFDYYQDIENVKPGTYKVSLQGFYRAGGFVDDYKTFVENPEANNNAFLYATTAEGTSSAPLLRLASEAIEQDPDAKVPDGWAAAKTDTLDATADPVSVTYTVVPNNMTEAEKCFNNEDAAYNYTGCEIFVKVGEDGKLRIGVKKETNIDNNWTIWTNWQLTYYGANSSKAVSGDPSGINATTGGNVVKTEFFSLSGAQIEKPAKGVAIMKQTLNDGSVNVQKVIVK